MVRFSRVATLLVLFLGACAAPPPTVLPTKHNDGGTQQTLDLSDPNASCGGTLEGCCPGMLCDTGLHCSKVGNCCGVSGFSCNTPSECCLGLNCTGGKCCSNTGSACTKASDCCAGLICDAMNTCNKPTGNCGDVNQMCCTGNMCTSGNTCGTDMMCHACGANGQTCCSSTPKCNTGLACGTNGMCGPDCGTAGKPCCTTGTQCQSPLTCNSGTCGTAGGVAGTLGNACLPMNMCNSGLTCISGKCQMQQTCNTVGQPCCTGDVCQNGLQCDESGHCQTKPTCTDLQALCSVTSQCCAGQCALTIQMDGSTQKSCCVAEGASCPDGPYDCCGFLDCQGGKCVCQADGQDCIQDSDCCQRDCDTSVYKCQSSMACTGGEPIGSTNCTTANDCCGLADCLDLASTNQLTCCYTPASMGTCSQSSDCCGVTNCDMTTHTCICQQQGSDCIGDDDCCDGLVCANANPRGTCQPG